jgi:hypothetical protein
MLYVLHGTLPDRDDLKSVDKQWFTYTVLSWMGGVVQSGVVAEGGRITKSQMIINCNSLEEGVPPCPLLCTPHRKLVLKKDGVTGSSVQTVKRGGD